MNFEVAKEYNDEGTRANGICASWLNQTHIAGLPVPPVKGRMPIPILIPQSANISVIGAGTVVVSNGEIEQVTNDSGHFKPTQENLKTTLKFFNAKGVKSFPPSGYCSYKGVAHDTATAVLYNYGIA